MNDAMAFRSDSFPSEPPERIGIDEVRLRGEFRTVLLDGNLRRIWMILPDNSGETVASFLKSLPNPGKVRVVATDFNHVHIRAARKSLPGAIIEIDRCWVEQLLILCVAKARIEEGRRLIAAAVEERGAAIQFPSDPETRAALQDELHARAKEKVKSLNRDSRLLRMPLERLDPSDRIEVEAWLGSLPLLREVHELAQKVHGLYDSDIAPETAEAYLNQWNAGLSSEAIQYLRCFLRCIRTHMPEVCAYWATNYDHN